MRRGEGYDVINKGMDLAIRGSYGAQVSLSANAPVYFLLPLKPLDHIFFTIRYFVKLIK